MNMWGFDGGMPSTRPSRTLGLSGKSVHPLDAIARPVTLPGGGGGRTTIAPLSDLVQRSPGGGGGRVAEAPGGGGGRGATTQVF